MLTPLQQMLATDPNIDPAFVKNMAGGTDAPQLTLPCDQARAPAPLPHHKYTGGDVVGRMDWEACAECWHDRDGDCEHDASWFEVDPDNNAVICSRFITESDKKEEAAERMKEMREGR